MGFKNSQQAYAQSVGKAPTNAPIIQNRNPTSDDVNYDIGQIWQNTDNSTLWYLNSQSSNLGYVQSSWLLIANTVGTGVNGLDPQTGISPVLPNGGGIITIDASVSPAGTTPIRTNGTGANTLDIEVQIAQAIVTSDVTNIGLSAYNSAHFSVDANGFVGLIGGGQAIDSIAVDAATIPGTNPVVPNSSGIVTVTGAQVAAGTTTNVIRTDSLAANTYSIEIQRSQAVASTTIGANGVSHFDSANFNVDANGFVQLVGSGTYYSLTPYIVGSDTHSQYSTIQDAINQAVIDGASSSNQKNIYVKPGTYTEDLTLPDGINIIGFDYSSSARMPTTSSVMIIGTHTLTTGQVKFQGVTFLQTNATVFDFQGGELAISNAIFDLTGTCIVVAFTTATAKNLNLYTCDFSGTTSSLWSGDSSAATIFISTENCNNRMSSGVSTFVAGSANINLYSFGDASEHQFVFNNNTVSGQVYQSSFSGGTTFTTGSSTTGSLSFQYCLFNSIPYAASNVAMVVTLLFCITQSYSSVVPIASAQIGYLDIFDRGSNSAQFAISKTGYSGSQQVTSQAFVQTTNATVTTLASILLNQLESITLKGTITAAQSDHSNMIGGDFEICARRASGGNVTLIGSVITNINSSSAATFTCDVDTGTQTVRVRVTGVAATTYNWTSSYSYQKILNNT